MNTALNTCKCEVVKAISTSGNGTSQLQVYDTIAYLTAPGATDG